MPERTTLVIGGVRAEVALTKVGAEPREAQYEVRRVALDEDGEPIAESDDFAAVATKGGGPPTDVFEATEYVEADEPEPVAASERVEHGLTVDDEWVDLTEQLNAIDAATILKEMEVDATVARNAIPNMRVRGAYYVSPAAPGASPALGYVWKALRDTGSAALVRRTKRKNQALGAVVPVGYEHGGGPIYLVLLELEWSANVRPVPNNADLTTAVANLEVRGRQAAASLVTQMHESPRVFEELRDERIGRRAELLEAARAGKSWAAPVVEDVETDESRILGELVKASW